MSKNLAIAGQAFVLVAVSVLTMAGVRAARSNDPDELQVLAEAPSIAFTDGTLTVNLTAAGPSPIKTVELWVDGELEKTEETTSPLIDHEISWMPDTSGWSSIEVKVTDEQGHSAGSAPVVVNVLEPAGRPHIVEGPDAESLEEVASAMGVTVEELLADNEGLSPDEDLGPGSIVFPPMKQLAPITDPEGAVATIDDGVLTVGPADGVFLYLTQDGVSRRVSDDPKKMLRAPRGRVQLGPHLPPLDDGMVEVEVWIRRKGVHLAAELLVPAHELAMPVTELNALFKGAFFTEPIPAKYLKATSKDQVEFEWKSNHPYDGVAWFISSKSPSVTGKLDPSGVLQSGQAKSGKFTIDLSSNKVANPSLKNSGQNGNVQVFNPNPTTTTTTPQSTPPLGKLLEQLINKNWVWVVPIHEDGTWAGPPSDVVELTIVPPPYDPSEAPPFDVVSVDLQLPHAPNPDLAKCVRVLSENPPFPVAVGFSFYLNQDGTTQRKGYGAASVTGTLPYPTNESGQAIYPFTACQGEKGNFSWGDTSCGLNPLCHISKAGTALSEAAIEFGEFLGDLASKATAAYNDLKNWAVKQVTSTLCPSAVEGPCSTMIEIGVDVLLTSVGVPPTLPEFDDLAAAAKGELVDLALDQLGVGSACDAIATAGTGKTCGELASQLDDMDACTFAPKGQEDNCRQLVAAAEVACNAATKAAQCTALSNSARDLVEKGYGVVINESIEAISSQVTSASLESLGFPGQSWPWGGPEPGHGCKWGGPPKYNIVCPLQTKAAVAFGQIPDGCSEGWMGGDAGKIVCSVPKSEIEVIPEPYGEFQPIVIKLVLKRNENPMPEGFACGPITAAVTTITPEGAVGQPYLPATEPLSPNGGIFGTGLHVLQLTLGEPNTAVKIPSDKKPPNPLEDLFDDVGDSLGASVQSADWKYLLRAGSVAGYKITGDCIADTTSPNDFGIAGIIPDPLPRMTPGATG